MPTLESLLAPASERPSIETARADYEALVAMAEEAG